MTLLYPAAAILYIGAISFFVTLHFGNGYSVLSHAVSDYGIGPTAGRFRLYGSVGIIAAAVLGIAILLDPRFPDRAGLYLCAVAILRIGVLAFPTDLEGQRTTGVGRLHYLFAVASFTLMYMAIDTLGTHSIETVADWAQPVLRMLRTVVYVSLISVVVCLLPKLRGVFGLVERVFLISTMIWLLVFAVAV